MVTEIVDITVKAESQDAFTDAVADGLRYVSDTPGFRTARLTRSAETPTRFVLMVEWDSIEAHTVGFRGSANFGRWRAVVGPHFDGTPNVEHFDQVVSYPTA
jgi:heme-degrading monooxygenase HmoA